MNDDGLRYLFAKALERAAPGDDCPSADDLLDACHGLLAAERAAEVIDHIATCPVCAEAWRLASRTPAPSPDRR